MTTTRKTLAWTELRVDKLIILQVRGDIIWRSVPTNNVRITSNSVYRLNETPCLRTQGENERKKL